MLTGSDFRALALGSRVWVSGLEQFGLLLRHSL